MPYFKLVIHNPPKDASFWFDYKDAVGFEDTEFENVNAANEAIMALCLSSGTDEEDNYSSDKPRAIPESAFIDLYAEESIIDIFW